MLDDLGGRVRRKVSGKPQECSILKTPVLLIPPIVPPDIQCLAQSSATRSLYSVTVAKKLYQTAANELSLSQLIMDVETFLILSSGRLLLCLGRTVFQRFCAAGENQQLAVVDLEQLVQDHSFSFSPSFSRW